MISNKLLKLARLIKCITEVSTDNGLLITDVEFAVGVEVFVSDAETGDLTPAPAGVYTTDDQVITVNEQGIIESIEAKGGEESIEDEEKPQETEENLEDEEKKDEEEKKEDEPQEEPKAEDEEEKKDEENLEDEKDAKIAELQGLLDAANAKIAELEAIIADYKAKEQETPESIDEENRKQVMQSANTRTDRILNVLKNKN